MILRTGNVSIPGLLFADGLVMGLCTVNGIQRGIDQIVKNPSDWNLKCCVKRTKLLVSQKRRQLKNDKWFMCDQLIEAM
jgi:hypothetical protein